MFEFVLICTHFCIDLYSKGLLSPIYHAITGLLSSEVGFVHLSFNYVLHDTPEHGAGEEHRVDWDRVT